MTTLRFVGSTITRFILWILSIALVLVVWYNAAPFVIQLLDFNLQLIKLFCAYLPPPYNAMSESALRGALGADKALLFAEGTVAVKLVFFLLKSLFLWPWRHRRMQRAHPAREHRVTHAALSH